MYKKERFLILKNKKRGLESEICLVPDLHNMLHRFFTGLGILGSLIIVSVYEVKCILIAVGRGVYASAMTTARSRAWRVERVFCNL